MTILKCNGKKIEVEEVKDEEIMDLFLDKDFDVESDKGEDDE